MARLPGRKVPGTSVRQIECGCFVKFWPVTGVEVVHYCKEHQKQADERWVKEPRWKKTLLYTIGAVVIGIPALATVLLFLYIIGYGLYLFLKSMF